MIQPATYVRKSFPVQAIQVTPENMHEVALWCKGEVKAVGEHDGRYSSYIWVDALDAKNERQKQAFVGDWVLKSDKGTKIYTKTAFAKSFDSEVEAIKALEEMIRNEAKKVINDTINNSRGIVTPERDTSLPVTYGVVVSNTR